MTEEKLEHSDKLELEESATESFESVESDDETRNRIQRNQRLLWDGTWWSIQRWNLPHQD